MGITDTGADTGTDIPSDELTLDSVMDDVRAQIGDDDPDSGADDGESSTEADSDDADESEGGDSDAAYLDLDEYGDYLVPLKVDGKEEFVPLREAVRGAMRQADYTRKTQELAADRETLEAFRRLDAAFATDPVGTLRNLAQTIGVDPADLVGDDPRWEESPEHDLDPDDPIARELAELRAWRQEIEQERRAREAAEAEAAVDREIEAVKVEFQDPDLDEVALLQFAVERNIPNLSDAYKAMHYAGRTARKKPKALAAKRKAPPVEGGGNRKVGVTRGVSKTPSLEEAWLASLSEVG